MSGAVAIASAPLRISLAGGGTDLPSFSERFGGTVVSLAIDRRVAVAVAPRGCEELFDLLGGGTRLDHRELMAEPLAAAAIRRVASGEPQLACVTAAPPRSGLGGSGAFLVALVHALRASRPPAPSALAEEASGIEMEDLGRSVGKQDHYIAALGGLQRLSFARDGRVGAESIVPGERLAAYFDERLLLFDTGLCHDASEVLADQDRKTRRADDLTLARLKAIHSLVEPMLEAIRRERVEEIGPILNEHWWHKAQLGDAVVVPRIASLYALALASGADGGKLVGAGGGGFLLLSSRAGQQRRLRAAMASAGARELRFGPAREGSKLRWGHILAPGAAVAQGPAS
jgi:D-glycero-alpha-D-manno-heptose-7-phosphate kinase